MNEDIKKHLRTQGKYSDMGKNKSRDKRPKISPASKSKESPEKKHYKRYSTESKDPGSSSFVDDDVSPVKYEENSKYHFDQLEEPREPIEIIDPGVRILSTTSHGDSVIVYEPGFLKRGEADEYYDRLDSCISWYSKDIVINGESYPQPRLVAWFGPFDYSYSGATLEAADMPDCVVEIKDRVEEYLRKIGKSATFNSVLLNLYRNGKDSVAWHSDDESSMGTRPTIASVSLGETRRFEMRPFMKCREDENGHESKDEYFVHLTHGSLIVMDGCMQDDWQHRVPKEYHDKDPRINLTFRTVYAYESVPPRFQEKEFKKKQVNSWNSNKTSSNKVNFDEEDFPPLGSVDFPPLKSNVNTSSSSYPDVKSDIHDNSDHDEFNDSSEHWDSEPSFDEKWKVEDEEPNNLNSFATKDVNSTEKILDDNDNSFEMNSAEESQLSETMSTSDIYEECVDKEPPKPFLNVLAKEFVPVIRSPPRPNFRKFILEDLLSYQVKLLNFEQLMEFSRNLKLRVIERFQEFPPFVREQLDFLCELTDGSQTEKNQRLISSRLVNIVSYYLLKVPNVQTSYSREGTAPNVQASYNREGTVPNVQASYNREGTVPNVIVSYNREGTVPIVQASYSEGTAPNVQVSYNREGTVPIVQASYSEGTAPNVQASYNREGAVSDVQASYNREGTAPNVNASYNREGTAPNVNASYNREGTAPNVNASYNREGTAPNVNASYNREGTSYNRQKTSYNRDGTFYNRDGTSYKKERTSYNRQRPSYDREETSYNRERTYSNTQSSYDREGTSHNRERTSHNNKNYNREPKSRSYGKQNHSNGGRRHPQTHAARDIPPGF